MDVDEYLARREHHLVRLFPDAPEIGMRRAVRPRLLARDGPKALRPDELGADGEDLAQRLFDDVLQCAAIERQPALGTRHCHGLELLEGPATGGGIGVALTERPRQLDLELTKHGSAAPGLAGPPR